MGEDIGGDVRGRFFTQRVVGAWNARPVVSVLRDSVPFPPAFPPYPCTLFLLTERYREGIPKLGPQLNVQRAKREIEREAEASQEEIFELLCSK